jgi:hypothetical protein
MSRWAIGQAEVDQLIPTRELQKITGAAANGKPLLEKANRTLATAPGTRRKTPTAPMSSRMTPPAAQAQRFSPSNT